MEQNSQNLDLAALVADQLAEPKPKWRSRTVIWLAVTVIGVIAAKLGYEVDNDSLTEIIGFVIPLIGVIGAAFGRAKSMQPITKKGAAEMRGKIELAVRNAERKVGSSNAGGVGNNDVMRAKVQSKAPGDKLGFWSSNNGPFFE